jgi:hypothetical protein
VGRLIFTRRSSALVGLVALIVGAGVPIACSSYGEEAPGTTTPSTNDATSDGSSSGSSDGDIGADGPTASEICSGPLKPGAGPSSDTTALCDGVMTQLDRDTKHCGQCGHECATAATDTDCSGGMCRPRNVAAFSGLQEVDLIGRLTDGNRIVAVTNRDAVVSMALDGTNPITHYSASDAGAGGLVETALVSGNAIFASVLSSGVYRVSERGSPPLLLGAGGIGAKGLAMLGTELIAATVPSQSVLSISATMKNEASIADTERLPTSILTDGNTVYWANTAEFADPDKAGDGEIVRYDLKPKALTRSRAIPTLSSIAMDATHIYYFEGNAQEIRRLAKNAVSGDSERIATWTGEPVKFATRIIVAGANLFLALAPKGSRNPKVLARVSKCGGAPVRIWGGVGFGSFLVESNNLDVLFSPLQGQVGITR